MIVQAVQAGCEDGGIPLVGGDVVGLVDFEADDGALNGTSAYGRSPRPPVMYFLIGKYMTGGNMCDAGGQPAALEQLREQRSRLADRMRPPWWYLTGSAMLFAVAFALPFISRYLPQGVRLWPLLIAAAWLLQWGLARATGISIGFQDLTYRPGRAARIAMLVVTIAATVTEHFLIDHGLVMAAAVVAALAVVAGVISVRAALRGIREDLRTGGGAV